MSKFNAEKVALVIYNKNNFGGAERRLIRIYNEMANNRKCDLIVRGTNKEKFLQVTNKANCNINNFSKVKFFDNRFKCLMYLLFKGQYTNIHYFDVSNFSLALAIFCKILGINTLLTIAYQNYALGLVSKTKKFFLSLHLNINKKIDVLFPQGLDYFPTICSNKNISVTPGTFTLLDKFFPQKKRKIIALIASRLEHDKNANLLLEASIICHKQLKELGYEILICGEGSEENDLRNKIIQNSLQDLVKMPGYIKSTELLPYVELACSLDLIENYPAQCVAEAVACGCSLICTDVGCSRKCGSEDFTYYIKNDPDELANTILSYVRLPENNKNVMSKQARLFAEKYYNILSSVRYFESLIFKK